MFWYYYRFFSPKQICLIWWGAQSIQSLCPLVPCWVYWALKLLKIYRDESASHRKGVVKIDTWNSIPSWWWCFTSPFKKSTRWLSILAFQFLFTWEADALMQRHSLVWDFGLSLTLQVFAERTKCPCVKRRKSHGRQLRKFDGVRNCPKFK